MLEARIYALIECLSLIDELIVIFCTYDINNQENKRKGYIMKAIVEEKKVSFKILDEVDRI